jgi:hypothetical protein
MNMKMRDEAMIAWKSRLIVEVYMPDKPERNSIKTNLVS